MKQLHYFVMAVCTATFIIAAVPGSAQTLAGGGSHSLVLTASGTVWSVGSNDNGQLGDNTLTNRPSPIQVSGLTNIVAVAAGAAHSLALRNDGTLYAWGDNQFGQLGDGTTTDRKVPTVVSLGNVVAIASGEYHTIALQASGDAYTWGRNNSGQLGLADTTNRSSPVLALASVSAIGSGFNHSLAVKTDGSAWATGLNGNGQLGDASTTQRTSFVQMSGVAGASRAVGGRNHSIILLSNGTLKATGYNAVGALGDGSWTQRTSPVTVSGLSNVSSVALGSDHSIALKADGSIWVWGYAGYYQLGDGTQTHRNTPFELPSMSSIAAVGAGHNHSLAVTTAGVVSVWGNNAYGQLGDGTHRQRSIPTSVSGTDYEWKVATPALSVTTNTFFSAPTVTVTVDTPGAVIHYTDNGADPTEADAIVASGSTIAVNTSRTLKAKAWKAGAPESNVAAETYTLQVSPPSFSPYWATTYTTPQTVTMSASAGTTIRFTNDGSAPTASSTLYTAPIAVGTATTLKAIALKDGWTSSGVSTAIYTMNFGTLAPPTMTPPAGTYQSSATVEMSSPQSGAVIRYTTNGLPPGSGSPIYTGPITVDASMTLKAKAFHPDYVTSAETSRAYTITVAPPTFSVQSGAYPAGHVVTITTPTPGATISYTIHGTDPTQTDRAIVSGGTLVLGNYTLKAKAWKSGATASAVTSATYTVTGSVATPMVAAGGQHSLLTAADGVGWGWGRNGWGQLADGTTTSPRLSPRMLAGLTGIAAVEGGADFSVLLKTDGTIYAAGTNGNGQLGDGTTTYRTSAVSVTGATTVSAIAAGDTHALAVKADGTVIAWGANYYGQVGDGTTMQRLTPTPVTGLTTATAVAAGAQFSLARLQGGTVVAWGYNAYSQLGDGSSTNRATPVTVSGITTATAIAAGDNHALAVLADGSVRAWGHGFSGQLGDGSSTTRSAPVIVSGLTGVVAVAAGQYHSLALKSDGSVYGFGQNAKGQLGDGTTTNRSIPVQVPNLANIVTIAAGQQHSLALEDDGTLWVWGANLSGQIGDGTTTDRLSPTVIAELGTSWRVAAPTISLASGTYSADQTATIAVSDSEATIHYTQNGEEPTENDPTIASGGTVAVTSNQTLKARAWKPWVLASATATATYTLKPITPAVSPDSGTYSPPTTVTLSTSTADATLRYTTDGTTPTVSSTLYSGPITVATTTTVKAAAFKSGWTTSDARTATYTINFGTLAAPTIDPASGSYEGNVGVTMAAQEGATIRYTTDGSEPTSTSVVYTAPISLGVGSFGVKARAFKTDWTPSDIATASFLVTSNDSTAPVITATVSPDPNSAGWNTSTVTVTFTCSDTESLITFCTSPTTVSATGTTVVTGRATDAAGNESTHTVEVSIDVVDPVISNYEPLERDVFPSGTETVSIRGSVADFLSGVNGVVCNGVAASITGQTYSCDVAVDDGPNNVTVLATDNAGNDTSTDVGITVGPATEPTLVEISPSKMTMFVGDRRDLQISDEHGDAIVGGTWTVADPTIAEIIMEDNLPWVKGSSVGSTQLSLTLNGLVATSELTVLAVGTEPPVGTIVWQLPNGGQSEAPKRGRVIRANAGANPASQAEFFFIDEGTRWSDGQLRRPYNQPTRIQAATANGKQLWSLAFNDYPVIHAAADNSGGLVLALGLRSTGYAPPRVRRLDGTTGRLTWEYLTDDGPPSEVAIHPDGNVYFTVEQYHTAEGYLVRISTDGLVTRWRLPWHWYEAEVSNPIIREDGSVVALVNPHKPDCSLVLVELPDGADTPQFTEIADMAAEPDQCKVSPRKVRLLPDGNGSLLVASKEFGWVRRLQPNGLSGPVWYANTSALEIDYAISDDGAYALIKTREDAVQTDGRASLVKFDPVTLEAAEPQALSVGMHSRLAFAIAGGGVYIASPSPVSGSPFVGSEIQAEHGVWAGWTTGWTVQTGTAVAVAPTRWSYANGDQQNSNAPAPYSLTTIGLRDLAGQHGVGAGLTGIQLNRAVGLAFQDIAVCSMRTITNTLPIYSPRRDFLTNGVVRNVIPDIVSGHWINSSTFFERSSFFEVKAVAGLISRNSNRHQINGFIDVAALSPVGQSPQAQAWNVRPTLTFLTTVDTVLSADIMLEASSRRVEIRQGVVEVLAGDRLRVGRSLPIEAGGSWWLAFFRATTFQGSYPPLRTGAPCTFSAQPLLPDPDDPVAEIFPFGLPPG